MQTKQTSILALGVALILSATAHAQLNIPSDGSDGAFSPNANVEIDLGLAANGAWTAPGGGNGVYDAEKWAVVFKYSSVNIPNGVTVTFKNHPSYAPVVWLVQGNVTIDGTLDAKGKQGTVNTVAALTPAEPGPGGFRGGVFGPAGANAYGYGPGTGPGSDQSGYYLGRYGNPQILPLIGGSGSWGGLNAASGGAGGGAIQIAAGQTITVQGAIDVRGGGAAGIAGSSGAIRLVANQVVGNGELRAAGNTPWTNSNSGTSYQWVTPPGRIRIEANSLAPSLQIAPETIGVPPANPPVIWPAANAPTAKVISVDSVGAPADPHAPLVAGADVAIQNSNQVNIQIQTNNFPIEGVVLLNVTPKFGIRTTLNATRISGDITQAIWRVQTTLPQGFVTLQARATQP